MHTQALAKVLIVAVIIALGIVSYWYWNIEFKSSVAQEPVGTTQVTPGIASSTPGVPLIVSISGSAGGPTVYPQEEVTLAGTFPPKPQGYGPGDCSVGLYINDTYQYPSMFFDVCTTQTVAFKMPQVDPGTYLLHVRAFTPPPSASATSSNNSNAVSITMGPNPNSSRIITAYYDDIRAQSNGYFAVTDINGKHWTVDLAKFANPTYLIQSASSNPTPGELNDYLIQIDHVGAPSSEEGGIDYSTFTGTLNAQGILEVSTILQIEG